MFLSFSCPIFRIFLGDVIYNKNKVYEKRTIMIYVYKDNQINR